MYWRINKQWRLLIVEIFPRTKIARIFFNLKKIYVVLSISFQIFLQAFKIVVDSWKCSMLLLCILWDDWPIFMISATNEQLQQQLEYTLLKTDCHSWWIWKMQWRHFRKTICNKIVLNLKKMPQKRMECFRLFFDHLAWIEHQFLSGMRDSRNAGSLWGIMRGMGGVRKSIHKSWLAKGLWLGLPCWGFKGVQEEIPAEDASFKSGQWHLQQDNAPVHNSVLVTDYLTRMGIKTVFHRSNSPGLAPCDFSLFPKLRGCRYETIGEVKEAVTKVIDTLTQEDFHGVLQKLLERYNKCIAAGGEYFEGD